MSAAVNVGLRTPGVLYVLLHFAPAALRRPRGLPAWVAAMQLALPVANVGYYTAQAVRRAM